MTIKTLEIIHDALKSELERRKSESGFLEQSIETADSKEKSNLMRKYHKETIERVEEIKQAINELENAQISIGG